MMLRWASVALALVIGFSGTRGVAAAQPSTSNATPPAGTAAPAVVVSASPIAGRAVSATGIGEVRFSGGVVGRVTLTVFIQGRADAGDLRGAIQAADQKAAAVRASVQALGIAPVHIRTMSLGVAVQYGPAASGAEQVIRGYTVNRTLQVDVSGPDQVNAAMRAALIGGATSVSAFPGAPQMAPPAAAALVPAVTRATQQAEVEARAAAAQLGASLGALQRVAVGPPQAIFTRPGEGVWRVEVTVTYALAQSR